MQKLVVIPSVISSLRITILPLLSHLFSTGNIILCLILLAFSAITDFFDGYFARKLKVTSRFGAYYDALTDFILVIGIFTIFSANGYYACMCSVMKEHWPVSGRLLSIRL